MLFLRSMTQKLIFFFLIYQTKTIKEIQYQIINKGNNTKQKVIPKQKPLKIKTP